MSWTVKITLVRHGETEANRLCIIQGQSDYPLNEQGRQQAMKAGAFFSTTTFASAHSSDLRRPLETAQLILGRTEGIKESKLLREQLCGVMENKSFEEFRAGAMAAGVDDDEFVPEGGETPEEVEARAAEFFKELCEEIKASGQDQDRILVVSHGGLIVRLLHYLVTRHGCSMPTTTTTTTTTTGQSDDYLRACPNTGWTDLKLTFGGQTRQLEHIECVALYNTDHLNS